MTAPVRINKFLSEVGFCSRRRADQLLSEGRVTINGVPPVLGTKVQPGDRVAVDGQELKPRTEEFTYIAFHKPIGIVCTTDVDGEPDNIIDYIGHSERIFPIGRLDKMSEGLIFLTNDGDIVNKILRAGNAHEKEYRVRLNKPIGPRFIDRMAAGVPILGTRTAPCEVEQISDFSFRIILTQGMNRQIRRMCEYFGYKVARLQRFRIMNVMLDLGPGDWRDLTGSEVEEIRRLTRDSRKTWDGSS